MGCVKIWQGDNVGATNCWKADDATGTAEMLDYLLVKMRDKEPVQIHTDHKLEDLPSIINAGSIRKVDPVSESMQEALISVAERGTAW